MKRQLTRKLSTAEFAHSHSGHGPPPNVARSTSDPGAAPTPTMLDGECTSLRPGPFTYTHAYHLSVLGVCRAPPRVSPVSARRRAAARALGSEAWAEGDADGAWRLAGATAEGGGGEARENFQDGHPLWPPAHQPGSGGFQRSTFGDTVVHHYRHVPVSSLESSRPPRSPSGCGGSSSAWRV